jgi:Protein of unknown function (DUF4238)
VSYQRVRRSHIVSAGYLRNFAIGGQIQMQLSQSPGEAKLISVRDAAVRAGFYVRQRPDGARIDDVEASFQGIENATAPILRQIAHGSISQQDKQKLAELFALQYLRGPRWRCWYEELSRESVERVRLGASATPGVDDAPTKKELERGLDAFLSPTYRLTRMIYHARKITMVLASMHWILLEFPSAVVAVSDDPVVFWPVQEAARRPQPGNIAAMDAFEVRVPVSPQHAILMTWFPDRDGGEALRGRVDQAMNLNAFTVAQADRQWFWQPQTKRPPRAAGLLRPLAPELLPGYGGHSVVSSIRHRGMRDILERRAGEPLANADLEIVVVE